MYAVFSKSSLSEKRESLIDAPLNEIVIMVKSSLQPLIWLHVAPPLLENRPQLHPRRNSC